jgi:hypothetical protein
MVFDAEDATSDAQRQRAWRRRRRASWRQSCANCGAIFTPSRRDQAFCSPSCRQRSHHRRKASGETDPRRPTGGPWRVFEAARPRNTPEAAPRAAVRTASGKIIEIASLIG